MKPLSIRKYLSILGLALVMTVMSQGINLLNETPAPWPPGPSVAGIILPDGVPAPFPPGPSIIAVL